MSKLLLLQELVQGVRSLPRFYWLRILEEKDYIRWESSCWGTREFLRNFEKLQNVSSKKYGKRNAGHEISITNLWTLGYDVATFQACVTAGRHDAMIHSVTFWRHGNFWHCNILTWRYVFWWCGMFGVQHIYVLIFVHNLYGFCYSWYFAFHIWLDPV